MISVITMPAAALSQLDCAAAIKAIQDTHYSEKLRIDDWRTTTQGFLDRWKSERALRQAKGKLSPEEFQAWMDGVYVDEIENINKAYERKIWQNDQDRDQAMKYVYRACQNQ